MNISVKELRTQPGRVLSLVKAGTDVTITLRGKPQAKIIPLSESEIPADDLFIGFGIWKDRDDMTDSTSFVESLRTGEKI